LLTPAVAGTPPPPRPPEALGDEVDHIVLPQWLGCEILAMPPGERNAQANRCLANFCRTFALFSRLSNEMIVPLLPQLTVSHHEPGARERGGGGALARGLPDDGQDSTGVGARRRRRET
jgi:hypothetical protein